ncbi:hypothetical protein [Streptomyces sp. NBC_01264]|uniref:hypothetical protein n=2 Tax=unclassified Streptomyces TaxID=2593676 RepID=UPI00224CCBD8|nr:hypothetical protein [Streptomyces sp. NBC_01264]
MPLNLPKLPMTAPLPRPQGAPADWPGFPRVQPIHCDVLLSAEEWPALNLSWLEVTPYGLGAPEYSVHALLIQPGVPGPVADAYRHPFNKRHPFGWGCRVLSLKGDPDGRVRMQFSCRRHGCTRTLDEARRDAFEHVMEDHPDAAVLYSSRTTAARYRYA